MVKKYGPVILLLATGFFSILLYLLLRIQLDLGADIPRFILIYLALFLFYINTILLAQNQDNFKTPFIIIIVIFAVAFRLCLLTSAPTLSNDIYRYIWDGKILANGINPYEHAPSSPQLQYLQDKDFKKMDHRDIHTSYPPFAEAVFAAAYSLSPHPDALKVIFLLFDLAIMALIFLILKSLKKNTMNIIIYAWSPLAVIEVSASGHLDPIAIFWLVLAVLFYYNQKPLSCAFSLALASLSKFLALPFLFLCAKFTTLKRCVFAIVFFCFFFIPFMAAGQGLYKGALNYLSLWEFNGSIFPILLYLTHSYLLTKIFIFIVLAAIFIYLLAKEDKFPRAVFIMLAALFMLSPSVHPWYLLWMLPFLCIYESPPWLVLTGTIVFSYSVLTGYFYCGTWKETIESRLFVYAPFYFLLLSGFIKRLFIQNGIWVRRAFTIIKK